MTDRERRELRGPVKTMAAAAFEWDNKAGALPEKPSRREELLYSPQGNLLAHIAQYGDGPIQRSTYAYDESGRLRETTWRNPDGTEGRSKLEYDDGGEIIQSDVKVTYSSENGRKVKTEVFAKTPGVQRGFSFPDGRSQTAWTVASAAVASTFYDGKGRPAEMVFYDDEHAQVSKLVRTYDERGRVTGEEQQIVSPRAFAGKQGTRGEEMPKHIAKLFSRIFSKDGSPMRLTFKYDDHDRVIGQTRDMGLFGYERTVSFYNGHGDLSKQQTYSTHQGEIPVDDTGSIFAPPPAPEKLRSETDFSYEYDDRGNWTRKKTSSLHDPGSRWESVERRVITYY